MAYRCSMVNMPDDYPRLPQRRPALRSVPSTERYVARPRRNGRRRPAASRGRQASLETLRKLWRHRWTDRGCAPSWWAARRRRRLVDAVLSTSSEARVLVGVQAPRVFNAEAIITDVNPDAERVQNEGFVLQSRTLAKMVIDKLKLADNPEFNPELRKPSLWSRIFSVDQFLPAGGQGLARTSLHAKAPARRHRDADHRQALSAAATTG